MDEAAFVDEHPGRLRAHDAAVGPAPDGDEHLVEHRGLGGLGLVLAGRGVEGDGEPVGAGVDGGDLGAQPDCLVGLGDPLGERGDDVLVRAGDELVHQLDHTDFGAEFGVDGGHLQPDDPATEHQQPFGNGVEVQGAGGVDDAGVVVRDERQPHRLRPGGDDRGIEADGGGGSVRTGDGEHVG